MTVQTTKNIVQFQGDGTATSFPFGFKALEPSHIDVFFVNTNTSSSVQGIPAGEIKKLDPSNFDVTVNQNSPGGTVKLTGVAAPPADITITIERSTPQTQQTNYVENDPFPAETHERALDKLTLIVQELEDNFDNGGFISAPPGEDNDCPPLPIAEERAGKLLGFNSAGCPTTIDISGLNVTAPQLFSDLSNVDVDTATDRQVASFDNVSGEWTPDDNVFTLNDQSGDLTISTNADGDITVSDEDGNTTTVVNNEDLGGAGLLKKFTAAENGSKGDFLAIRSNAEVEKIAQTTSTGGTVTTSTVASGTQIPLDAVYVSSQKTHVLVYTDSADNTIIRLRMVTLDADNQTVDTIGSEQTIFDFTNNFSNGLTTIQYDSVNDRLVIVTGDADNNNQIIGFVLEPDWANLSISSVGSKQSLSTVEADGGEAAGSGYDPDEAAILYVFPDDPNFNQMYFLGMTVDPNNNTISAGSAVANPNGGSNGDIPKKFPYSSSNNVFGVVGVFDGVADTLEAVAVSLSGNSVTLGSFVTILGPGDTKTAGIAWDDQNQFFVVLHEENDSDNDDNLWGTLLEANGTSLTVVDNRKLADEAPVLPDFPDMWVDSDGASWVIGHADPASAGTGAARPTVLTGSVNPDVPRVVITSSGSGAQSLLTPIGPENDAEVGPPAPTRFDPDFNGAVMFYDWESGNGEETKVTAGSIARLTTNRGQWIGTATEDFTAGSDVTVALRGSEVFVNTNTPFQPGDRLFLDQLGQLATTGTFTAGIATKANERLVTAGIGGGEGTGSTGTTTASSVDEELLDSRNITSTVSEIVLDLPSGYVRHVIEILEFQAELASPGFAIMEFSTDGGSTFVTSGDYDNATYNLKSSASEALLGESNNISRLELSPPPQTGNSLAIQYRTEVFSADSTLFTNTFSMLQENQVQEGRWLNHSGILKRAEKHNAVRIRLDGGGIARAFVRVKGLVK